MPEGGAGGGSGPRAKEGAHEGGNEGDRENFLSRWARRKAEASRGTLPPETPETTPATAPLDTDGTGEPHPRGADAGAQERVRADAAVQSDDTSPAVGAGEQAAPAIDWDTFDFDALDYQSDYTKFMGADVPPHIRNKALAKLWTSDPVLANLDGLDDYQGDYTDAAVAVPMGQLKTAYRVGRGFLSDEEVAAWDELGKPEGAATVAGASAPVSIAAESPEQAEVQAFFAASEAYMGALYPAESNHFAPASHLARDNVVFLVARDGQAAVGCGAIVIGEAGGAATCEIKRMWVDRAARGRRIGQALLERLEAEAAARGVRTVRLETGIHQDEAIGLYRRQGYTECAPFGSYQPDPLSIFMEKAL